jgi:hypothetical protein
MFPHGLNGARRLLSNPDFITAICKCSGNLQILWALSPIVVSAAVQGNSKRWSTV